MENQHDKLFKSIASIKENAADLMQGTFPPELVENIDFDTLTLDSNSYVDETLSEFYSDLVYNCVYKCGGKNENIKISLLFEHKSYKPVNEHLQLLRYMLNIWQNQVKNNEKIQVIVPYIFYHGIEKWEPAAFMNKFRIPDQSLAKYIPSFEYILADAGRFTDDEIRRLKFKENANKVLTLLFKYYKDEEYIRNNLSYIFVKLKEIFERAKDSQEVSMIFVYMFETFEIEIDEYRENISRIFKDGGESIMSTAQVLRDEGRKEGEIKGRQEGIAEGEYNKSIETVKNMIAEGFEIAIISKITGLSIDEIKRLKN